MGTSGHTLYIKGEKNKELAKTEVLLGDVLSMECTDQTVVSRLKTVKLLRGSLKKRYVVSILEVISRIHEIYPNLTVENMGETDLIITIEDQKKNGKVIPLLKSVFVLLVTFIGAGFSIMSFNNDVDVPKLFNQIYFLVTGNRSDGFGILELTYCIGMSVGILLFFNHFGKRRFTVDPTPMEVEMRTYEEEIEMTLIDEYSRKKEEKDVG
ncbi:MAG TPA: stage V sporulation protein AA [Candidatus Sellimonas avistercoris]|nr:stage V sporulation protein AA [Candidatus Sellimonas avistercoris]